MDNELYENLEDNIDEKEKLLLQIESFNITTLLYFFNGMYAYRIELEETMKKNKLSRVLEGKYRECIENINLMENDEEIQEAIYKKIQDIDYDEESIESRATAVHSIGAAMGVSHLLIKIEKNTKNPVEYFITEILEDMKKEDLIQIIEWIDYEKIKKLPKVHSVFINRINELTEAELIIYLVNCIEYKYDKNIDLASKVLEKVKNGDKAFLPFYISYFLKDDNTVSELLNYANNYVKVSAIISADLSKKHSQELTSKLKNMVEGLSEDEFIQFICGSIEEENEEYRKIIINKMFESSKDNMKFILFSYLKNIVPTYKHEVLVYLALVKEIAKEKNGSLICSFNEQEINKNDERFKTYYCSHNFYTEAFPYFSGFDMAKLNGTNFEIPTEEMVNAFLANKETISKYTDFLDFICSLAKTKDDDLYKIILDVNRKYKIPKDMDNCLERYLHFTEVYLINRILNIKNEQLLNKLYILSSNDAPLFSAIRIRMDEKGLIGPDSLNVEGNVLNNFEEGNKEDKTKENGELDSLRGLE